MENFSDIEGPVRIGLGSLLPWIAGAGVLLAALLFLFYRLRKQHRQEDKVESAPKVSPLQRALQRLGILRKGFRDQEAETFTVEVSDIVRDYLEEVLEIPAKEQTSEEFLHALTARKDLPDVLHEAMPAFLEACDRVKFARQDLTAEQREPLLQTAEAAVRETHQALQPASGSQPSAAQ